MAKSTSSNYKTKKEAQNALDRFKMEVASEIGVNYEKERCADGGVQVY